MKKLLFRLFVLDYKTVMFGKVITFVRPSTIIYNLLLISALSQMYLGNNLVTYTLFGLLGISVILGFGFEKIFKMDVSLLDVSQKYQLKYILEKNPLPILSEENEKAKKDLEKYEFDIIEYENMMIKQKFYNLFPFLLNFVVTAIAIGILVSFEPISV